MENDIQILFTKLFIPTVDIPDAVLDLSYEDKKFKFKYPQTEPLVIPLTNQFIKEKQTIVITVMTVVGKQYKKIARGEINVYKKYFLGDKTFIEKWIHLNLFETQLQSMSNNTDILKAELNQGKIFMNITLLHPVEMKQKLLLKDPIQANKTEKYRSIVENSNQFLKKIKGKSEKEILEDLYEDIEEYKEGEFEDGLSELSISVFDPENENREGLNMNQFAQGDYVKKLKEMMEADYETILPKDVYKLRQLNEHLYAKYNELSQSYNQILTNLNTTNESMRVKAKEFYEKYKEIKKSLPKERKNLRERKIELKNAIRNNKEQNKKLKREVGNYQNEVKYFRNKMNIDEPEQAPEFLNKDTEDLVKLLRKVQNLGYDIYNGSGITEAEKAKLKTFIGEPQPNDFEPKIEEKEKNGVAHEGEEDEDNYGNMIIELIEKEVNELFSAKKIKNVSIDQVTSTNYTFSEGEKQKSIDLRIQNDRLTSINGESFQSWLLKNFAA